MRVPLVYKCEKCRSEYTIGGESTLFLYIKQPIVNHVETTCLICDNHFVWWQADDSLVEALKERNGQGDNPVRVVIKEFAADRTWQNFSTATGIRYPHGQRLGAAERQRINNYCAMFRYLLETGAMP